MPTQFDSFIFRAMVDHLDHQEKIAHHRKHLYLCAAYQTGHVAPLFAGKTTSEVVAFFWQECGALSMLTAGPDQESQIESAIADLRSACATSGNYATAQRAFHLALLKVADRSLSDGFVKIWSFHAPFITFPASSMKQGRAIAAIRHLPFYASNGNDSSAARAMADYLNLVLKRFPTAIASGS